MLNLSSEARLFVSRNQKQTLAFDDAHLSLFTRRQLEAVTLLFNFNYESRCSFQKRRFRVSFFGSLDGESLTDYLRRRAFIAENSYLIPDIYSDETHEPEGLDLTSSGAVAILKNCGPCPVYSAIEMILERDALLVNQDSEYAGTIVFKSSFTEQQILSQLTPLELYPPASDDENLFIFSKDTICVLQRWHYLYTPTFMGQSKDWTMRVFSSKEGAFDRLSKRFKSEDLVCVVPSNFR